MPPFRAVIGVGFLIGLAAASLWVLWGAIGAIRLCRRAGPAPRPLFLELAQLVGDARRPRLLLSRRIGTAAALGILRPTIVLRADLTEQDSPQSLRAVLRHEWADIRNHDLWLLALAQRALAAVCPSALLVAARPNS